jgi:hypothetical protein
VVLTVRRFTMVAASMGAYITVIQPDACTSSQGCRGLQCVPVYRTPASIQYMLAGCIKSRKQASRIWCVPQFTTPYGLLLSGLQPGSTAADQGLTQLPPMAQEVAGAGGPWGGTTLQAPQHPSTHEPRHNYWTSSAALATQQTVPPVIGMVHAQQDAHCQAQQQPCEP